MKEEFLEVYSPEGTKTGQKKSKSEIHRKGLFHSTVHVWIFTDEGNILIQKRSKKKELNPGVWDVSVAGHIKFNENIKKAAKRETLEETGININTKDLLKIGVYKSINIAFIWLLKLMEKLLHLCQNRYTMIMVRECTYINQFGQRKVHCLQEIVMLVYPKLAFITLEE